MGRFRQMLEEWTRERLPSKRDDRVSLDTLRSGRAVDRANAAIKQIEDESVLQRRVRLIERRRREQEGP